LRAQWYTSVIPATWEAEAEARKEGREIKGRREERRWKGREGKKPKLISRITAKLLVLVKCSKFHTELGQAT
jgi:hypothetical protein